MRHGNDTAINRMMSINYCTGCPTARRSPSLTETGGTQPNRLRAFQIATCKPSNISTLLFKNNSYSRSVYGGYSPKSHKLIGI